MNNCIYGMCHSLSEEGCVVHPLEGSMLAGYCLLHFIMEGDKHDIALNIGW